jgi:hypothetical protein
MKKTFAIILLLFNIQLFSQPITFSKIYNPYNKISFSLGGGIQKKGNGYITIAAAGDTLNGNFQHVLLNEIDSVGNLVKIISLASDSFDYYGGGYGSLIQTSDGGYFIPCSKRYSSNNSDHYLIRFDANMDTLWTKTIDHDSVWEIYYQSCETYDKGFAMVGTRVQSSGFWDVLIAKTDSLGNKLWEKTISMGNYNGGDQIKETPDKGFLICGYRSTDADGSGDPFIIKTDSAGNVKWSRILGNPNQKDGSAAIAITNQGDYLVAYGYSTYTYPMNMDWSARLNVIKYSSNGNQILNRMYDTIKDAYFVSKIQIYPNNDFIVIGAYAQPTQGVNYSFFPTFMFKFNANCDSLYRKIYYYSNRYVNENILRDFVLNTDGCLTAIGHVNIDTMNPRQKIWMVKTDSNGYAPGCYPTGVEEYYITQRGQLQIFPNPATTQTTITYPMSEKEIMLQIYNMLGQVVYEEKLPKGSSQTTIDTRTYKKGLYKVVAGESSGSLLLNGE